jgi:hypothetical protein
MIVRYVGDRTLVDAEALAVHTKRRVTSTMRARCRPVVTDLKTGLPLYDIEEAAATLEGVPQRAPHRRPTRRKTAA